jgi:tetratricopeptide (TPR) repeat protein
VVAVVLGALVAGAWGFYRVRESRGLAALAAATALLPPDGLPATPEARDRATKAFEGVLSEYPRFSAAPQAAYQLGNLKYAAGRYDEARSAYALALSRGASGTAATMAGMGIGYAWEAEKKYPEAAAAYEAVASRLGPKDFLFEEALAAEARAQEQAGKSAAALELYQRLLRDVPESRQAEDLRNRIANLKSQPGPAK